MNGTVNDMEYVNLIPSCGPVIDGGQDELYDEAKRIVRSTSLPSVSFLQRKLHVDFDRAARLRDDLEKEGIWGVPGLK